MSFDLEWQAVMDEYREFKKFAWEVVAGEVERELERRPGRFKVIKTRTQISLRYCRGARRHIFLCLEAGIIRVYSSPDSGEVTWLLENADPETIAGTMIRMLDAPTLHRTLTVRVFDALQRWRHRRMARNQ